MKYLKSLKVFVIYKIENNKIIHFKTQRSHSNESDAMYLFPETLKITRKDEDKRFLKESEFFFLVTNSLYFAKTNFNEDSCL